MRIEETIMDRTSRTPSGGGFWLLNSYFPVRYGQDWWEWKYRGNFFYDLQDLAEEIMRRSGAGSRLVGHYLRSMSGLRKAFRARVLWHARPNGARWGFPFVRGRGPSL